MGNFFLLLTASYMEYAMCIEVHSSVWFWGFNMWHYAVVIYLKSQVCSKLLSNFVIQVFVIQFIAFLWSELLINCSVSSSAFQALVTFIEAGFGIAHYPPEVASKTVWSWMRRWILYFSCQLENTIQAKGQGKWCVSAIIEMVLDFYNWKMDSASSIRRI